MYQVEAGAVTPVAQWASEQAASGPVQNMVLSTPMVLPSRHSTLVEKSAAPRVEEGKTVAWERAGMPTVGPSTGPDEVM